MKKYVALPETIDEMISLVAGIWLLGSPLVLQYSAEAVATKNSAVVGFLVLLCGTFTIAGLRAVEEWINTIFGAWLLICPLVMEIQSVEAKINFVIVGALLVTLDVYALLQRVRSVRGAPGHG